MASVTNCRRCCGRVKPQRGGSRVRASCCWPPKIDQTTRSPRSCTPVGREKNLKSTCRLPKVMLFDEPTSALDPELLREVREAMRGLARDGRDHGRGHPRDG